MCWERPCYQSARSFRRECVSIRSVVILGLLQVWHVQPTRYNQFSHGVVRKPFWSGRGMVQHGIVRPVYRLEDPDCDSSAASPKRVFRIPCEPRGTA
jgi:hypothetical protein